MWGIAAQRREPSPVANGVLTFCSFGFRVRLFDMERSKWILVPIATALLACSHDPPTPKPRSSMPTAQSDGAGTRQSGELGREPAEGSRQPREPAKGSNQSERQATEGSNRGARQPVGAGLSYRYERRKAGDEQPSTLSGGMTELELEGFRPAVVSLPSASGRQRVFVVAHGAGGHAESHCSFWRNLLGERGIIVCPRGTAIYSGHPERGWFYANHHELEAEVVVLEKTVRKRFAQHLAPGGWVYAGYSQGATMGALMIVDHGNVFSHLALIEGGTDGWTRGRAQSFAQGGGKKVLFVCGQDGCARAADGAVNVLEAANVRARLRHAEGGGHTYGGKVGRELERGLVWLLKE